MSRYCLSHLSDPDLLRSLHAAVARERYTTADLLAHLAEVDARKLYLPAAYPSMFAYCVGELRLSEDAAYKRIQAARVARRFPVIYNALAEGRLHLSGVGLLAPYLTEQNADDLLAAAAGKTKSEIEQLLVERFPRSEMFALVQPLGSPTPPDEQLAPGQVEPCDAELAPGQVHAPAPPARVAPVAPERYALQLTIGKGTHDKLRHAQALLGHQVPSGEVAEVLDRALDALIAQLERRKFAATSRPRPRRHSANPRHVPAEVKRAVWERDGGQCTFVSESGHRCPARSRLEFDHAEPVARGGRATVEGIRLRCRAHNQYGAERIFGAGFMERKREEAREEAAERAKAAAAERAQAEAAERAQAEAVAEHARAAQAESARQAAAERAKAEAAAEHARAAQAERARQAAAERAKAEAAERAKAEAVAEVIPWLRALGYRADEARRGAEVGGSDPEATLDQRLRAALRCLAKPRRGRAA